MGQVSELLNIDMISDDLLYAELLKRFRTARDLAVQSIALDRATLLSSSGLLVQLLELRVEIKLLATRSAQQTSLRTGFAVWSDGEPFVADLAILQLARQRSRFLVHISRQRIHKVVVFFVVRTGLFLLITLTSLSCLVLFDCFHHLVFLVPLAFP